MSNIIILLVGVTAVWQAFQMKFHPERAKVKRAFRLGKNREKQIDLEQNPGIQDPIFVMFFVMGLLFCASALLSFFLGINCNYLIILATLVSGFVFFITMQRFTGSVRPIAWVVLALLTLAVLFGFWYASQKDKVEVLPEALSIEGGYGTTLHYASIDSVWVLEEMPETKYCKRAFGLVGKKGEFRLKDGSDATFCLQGKKAPYLKLETDKGFFYLNAKTPEETEQVIEALKPVIKEKFVE